MYTSYSNWKINLENCLILSYLILSYIILCWNLSCFSLKIQIIKLKIQEKLNLANELLQVSRSSYSCQIRRTWIFKHLHFQDRKNYFCVPNGLPYAARNTVSNQKHEGFLQRFDIRVTQYRWCQWWIYSTRLLVYLIHQMAASLRIMMFRVTWHFIYPWNKSVISEDICSVSYKNYGYCYDYCWAMMFYLINCIVPSMDQTYVINKMHLFVFET